MGDETKTITGAITKIDGPIASKGRNNATFYAVEIEGDKFYDWKHVSENFSEGDFVKATVTEGDYPRLLTMNLGDAPAVQRNVGGSKVHSGIAPGWSQPAQTPEGLTLEVLALAVELVKDEQVQVDDKIKRAKTAFFAFKDLLRIEDGKVPVQEGVKIVVDDNIPLGF